MKKLSALSLALVSLNSFAATKDLSIQTYCKTTNERRELSRYAVTHDGTIASTDSVGEGQQSKKEYYRGCRYDTPWMENMYQALCNNDGSARTLSDAAGAANNVETPKNILFFFDGAGDFNASKAKVLDPVNIDGSEGVDLKMGNANGLRGLITMMNQTVTRYQGPKVLNINHTLKKFKNDIELHYHAGSGFMQRENYASAIACAKETKYNLEVLTNLKDNKTDDTKWFVMGYSNGGALTIDFQNESSKFDVNVDLAFAIDPIVQTAYYMFSKGKKNIGVRHESTKRFVTMYQQDDRLSMSGFELRGKPVLNADENILLTSYNSNLASDGSYNHIRIPSDFAVYSKTNCEFSKILDNGASCTN